MNIKMENIKQTFLPSPIIIFIFAFIVYYWNILFYSNSIYEKFLVILSIISTILGYNFIRLFKKVKKGSKIKGVYDELKLRTGAWILLIVGILSHAYYYFKYSIYLSSYGAGYTVGRGKGYITAFFDLYIMGILLLLQSNKKKKNKKIDIICAICSIVYILFYLFILMKRRQIILLILGILIIKYNDILKNKKKLFYFVALILYIIFNIFGKTRGIYDVYGLRGVFKYILENIDISWFYISQLEGKYISMIFSDVVGYVSNIGINPNIILGVVSIFFPRKMFGFKYLSFPSWYTSVFYPDLYYIGTGFAGSMIAETYLIGHVPFLITMFFIIGILIYRIKALFYKEYYVLYALSIYILTLLPRLDLASIFIMYVFSYLPVLFIYLHSNRAKGINYE